MKNTLLALALTVSAANAAISINGTAVTNARKADGSGSVVSGSLALLIVDTAGDGFLGLGSIPSNGSVYKSASDPGILSTAAGLNVNSTFGGDLVLNRISTGTGSIAGLLSSVDIASYLNKSFAVVWFDGVTFAGAGATATSGSRYGIVRGSDWVFPSANTGDFGMNSTDNAGVNSFYQVNANVPAANASNFRTTLGDNTTSSAAFQIIPEPSAALLGAVGALGLLRRRRN